MSAANQPASITFEIARDQNIRVATFRGIIRDEDLLGTYGAVLADPSYDPSFHDLVDLTAVTSFDVSSEGVRQLADGFRATDALGLHTRLAIVAPNDALFGMSRMYGILRDDAPEEIQVFRNRTDATAWLAMAGVAPHP